MPEFRVCTLFSGSSGNCLYAECADGAILIDAGGSGKQIADAAARIGGHLDRVDGLLLSHDHRDHTAGAGILSRRYGMPIFMTEGTYATRQRSFGKMHPPQLFRPGQVLAVGGFQVHTLTTPHDGAQPVAFILERNGVRCGVLTDLGYIFPELQEVVGSLDAVVIESNYDPHMLRNGTYPEPLKARIASPRGHISNEDAAILLRDHTGIRLQLVMLAHLSDKNNTPELALSCMREHLAPRIQSRELQLLIAPRYQPSAMMVVRQRKS